MKKHILTFLLCIICILPAAGAGKTDFASVRAMADKGAPRVTDVLTNFVFAEDVTVLYETTVKDNLYIEGHIVGSPARFPRNENLEIAWQLGSKSASPKNNARTMYLESTDGRYGFRLFFDNANDAKNAGTLFGLLELNLKGATLVKEYNYYVITGLTTDNVIGFEKGSEADIPVKKMHISDLSDEDIFTWVSLQDCELVFKGGAWMNVRETYLPKSKTGRYTGNNWMNSWCRLACDNAGGSIYLGLDAKLSKRREGDGVPGGSGEVAGVLTKAWMPRYGAFSEYILRPPSLEEVRFSRDAPSQWKTIAGWDWNTPSEGMIPAEQGKGFLTTDYPGKIARFSDCDNPSIDLPKENPASRGTYGSVDNGAMSLQGRSCDWWNWDADSPRSIMVAFSTAGLEGTALYFSWTFSAGQYTQPTSCSYPAHWRVSYSTDGKKFAELEGPPAMLHSLPYISGAVDGKSYETSAEAGIGYTEHLVWLPASLLGQRKVIVRLSPADKTLANMAYLHRDCMEATSESTGPCTVNIGEIQIRYK